MRARLDPRLLEDVTLFKRLPKEALHAIGQSARAVRRSAGQPFFREGEPATAFFVLGRGLVKMVQGTPEGQEVTLRLVGPGGTFGAVASFTTGGRYPATAVALRSADAAAWDGPVMTRLMKAYPDIAFNALREVAARLHDLQCRHRELMTERVERRVARALLRLARDAGRRVEAGVEIDFPLRRQDLAEMTGTTLFTVSRILSAWRTQGLVTVGRQRVVIRRPRGLVRIAEDLPG